MELIPGRLYQLKDKSHSIIAYKYIMNSHGTWSVLNLNKKLIPIDLVYYMNKPMLCIAKNSSTFGIFLAAQDTIGLGIQDLVEL